MKIIRNLFQFNLKKNYHMLIQKLYYFSPYVIKFLLLLHSISIPIINDLYTNLQNLYIIFKIQILMNLFPYHCYDLKR